MKLYEEIDLLLESRLEPPPRMLSDMLKKAEDFYAKVVIGRLSLAISDGTLDNLSLTEDDAKGLIGNIRRNNIHYKGEKVSATTTVKAFEIEVDVTGWKYVSDLSKEEVEGVGFERVKLVGVIRGHQWGNASFQTPRFDFPRITFYLGGDKSSISSYQDFSYNLDRVLSSIEHESIHLSQYMLGILKTVKGERLGRPSKHGWGEWAKKFPSETALAYYNNPEEFWPWLNDEIEKLERLLSKTDAPRSTVINLFVDITDTNIDGVRPSNFFRALKIHDKSMWKKAVRELFKEIDKT